MAPPRPGPPFPPAPPCPPGVPFSPIADPAVPPGSRNETSWPLASMDTVADEEIVSADPSTMALPLRQFTPNVMVPPVWTALENAEGEHVVRVVVAEAGAAVNEIAADASRIARSE